jgi:hypothetical protein
MMKHPLQATVNGHPNTLTSPCLSICHCATKLASTPPGLAWTTMMSVASCATRLFRTVANLPHGRVPRCNQVINGLPAPQVEVAYAEV